jgi:hypothetical protein
MVRQGSRTMRFHILVAVLFVGMAAAGCIQAPAPSSGDDDTDTPATGYVPRVIIGIPDSGINPYHEMYYRPDLTMHPSWYIEGFPADIPALELTLGGDDYDEMFEADKETWANIEEDTWYWIPQSVFVAVYCQSSQSDDHRGEYCILDDGNMHGTGTTSSALMENPHALFAFKAGGSGIEPFIDAGIPVDIFSVSWGTIVPIPVDIFGRPNAPIYVLAAGNDPRPTFSDGWAGDPRNIVVGGAYAADQSQEILAAHHPDVVSYFCRPTAQQASVSELRDPYCGTSFAAPTVAGALSHVIYQIRAQTGYTGGIEDDYVDPIAGITVAQLREAMNLTATYDPEPRYNNTRSVQGVPTGGIPLNEEAPWIQWGWGFYDGLVAEATLAHLMGLQTAEAKPEDAHEWMQTMRTLKEALHG